MRKRAERDRLSANEWRTNQFLTELYWRGNLPTICCFIFRTLTAPLRPEYARFPWQPDAGQLRAWQRGATGVPMVDAGMRELWATGWMHNRVRMIVASFLVKNLLVPWQHGARWFWDTLLDADLASNTLRLAVVCRQRRRCRACFVFSEVSQGRKFDPEGVYVRGGCRRLANYRTSICMRRGQRRRRSAAGGGGRLSGNNYRPLVDLEQTRARALQAYQVMRETRGST
ncbi:MAG: FAD-binding domain-containing protein [Steroidobacteraceae bacterium]